MPNSTTRLRAPIRYRNPPDTEVPMTLVALCSPDPSVLTWESSARMPKFRKIASMKTTVE